MENTKEYFMLLVEGSERAPKFVHESETLAEIEAKRLNSLFNKPVYILKIQNVIESKIIQQTVVEKIKPSDFFNELPF